MPQSVLASLKVNRTGMKAKRRLTIWNVNGRCVSSPRVQDTVISGRATRRVTLTPNIHTMIPVTTRRHSLSSNPRRIAIKPNHNPKARFPFKLNRLRCVRCVNENRKKRERLRWQAANHGCHCFDRAFLLAGACDHSFVSYAADNSVKN